MHMDDRAIGVVMKQVFAPHAGPPQHPAVHHGRRTSESALWAGHRDGCTAEPALVQPGQPVQSMPFGHARSQPTAPGTGGAW